MATKNATFRNGQTDYFGAQFDGGHIDLLDGSDNVLSTITLQSPAFNGASNGQISAKGLPIAFTGTNAAGSGTDIASADLESSDGSQKIIGLTVGTSNSHVVLDNINIADGQSGKLNTFTITVPKDIQNA